MTHTRGGAIYNDQLHLQKNFSVTFTRVVFSYNSVVTITMLRLQSITIVPLSLQQLCYDYNSYVTVSRNY